MVPALAVADALRARGASVSFAGTRDRSESTLVPAAGYEIDFLRLRGLDRSNPVKAAGALGLAARALPAAARILREREADAVMGGGGYVAAPVGAAAVRHGLPLVLTEADRHLGLANRLLARRARRVCLAFPIDGLEGGQYTVTGRPVPAGIVMADRSAARARFGVAADSRCLLVFGGSQGARSVNDAALDVLLDPGRRNFHVIHITGTRDFAGAKGRVGSPPPAGYTLIEYEPTLADALAACDLVLARAGASVFELAAAGRPAILVPYPHATGRHQHANAEWMADARAAVVVDDEALSGERILAEAGAILGDEALLRAMSAASRGLAMPDAADRVADEILASVVVK